MGVYTVNVSNFTYNLKPEQSLSAGGYDAIVYAPCSPPSSKEHPEPIRATLQQAAKLDANVETEGGVFEINLPSGRLIYSPTGPLNLDYQDVRSLGEAANKGISRALKAGAKSPLLVLPQCSTFPFGQLVSLLGALEALYLSIQYREDCPDKNPKVKSLGVWGYKDNREIGKSEDEFLKYVTAIEIGRCAARDIGGGDPERMAPPKIEEYIKALFLSDTNVKINVISDIATIEKEYPLFAAVNRAASVVERHRGRIIYLTYEPENATETLLLVGKGVTYDTGGLDIKVGGAMLGMSRDKCGAAAVAGFIKVVSLLKPQNLKIVGALCIVRNSCGSNGYVSDECIKSRSNARVRIVNTDAEGRTIMADVLCYMKELAHNMPNPHLMTIATLTGHACLSAGSGYSIVMDNAVAKKEENSVKLQKFGELIGDPFEISYIRREDFKATKGTSEGDDLLQSTPLPSVRTARGHQIPAAFLIMVSGLDKHGLDSKMPLKYSHLDIAASSGALPAEATGAPILALTARYIS
ncbi:dipeptidase B [Lycorma delicatula]|uniref:dipeptidase B n=1 Tax=Lycorma delicatula TaxID=130591 RepID=UPI003F516D19